MLSKSYNLTMKNINNKNHLRKVFLYLQYQSLFWIFYFHLHCGYGFYLLMAYFEDFMVNFYFFFGYYLYYVSSALYLILSYSILQANSCNSNDFKVVLEFFIDYFYFLSDFMQINYMKLFYSNWDYFLRGLALVLQ